MTSIIRIFTDKGLHSEIETADEVTKIEVEGLSADEVKELLCKSGDK